MKITLADRIVVLFMISGSLSLIVSVVFELQVLAFVGLGLTFWGALFFFLKPVKYVGANVLIATVMSSYSTIDRVIKDYNLLSKCYYIAAFPKDVYLPQHLKGLKDATVFIPATDSPKMPSVEDLAQGKFNIESPKGVLLTSPGADLLAHIEKQLSVDFSKIQLEQMCEVLPRSFSENLNLAKEVAISLEENRVHLQISDSLFKNLYSQESDLKSSRILGCPIASATACAIAKATGKPVTLEKQKVSADGMTIDVWFTVFEGVG